MKKILFALLFTVVSPVLPGYLFSGQGLLTETHILFICETEHQLLQILSWEEDYPARYNSVTKKGKLTPVEAAQQLAGKTLADDRIDCNTDMIVFLRTQDTKSKREVTTLLPAAELGRYCPRTLKKYGYPCR